MPDLPTDIIEEFISDLNGEIAQQVRLASLLPCCLVCRSWRAIAQPLLFSRIVVDCRRNERWLNVIYTTISENPHLQNYVQALWIEGPGPTTFEAIKSLGNLVPRLSQLRVHISDYRDERAPELVPVFEKMFASERLTSLSFLEVAVPVALFNHCTALKELDLREATFHGMDSEIATELPNRQKLRIQSLCVFSTKIQNVQVLQWFLSPQCPFDWSDLRTFLVSERSDIAEGHETLCKFVEHVSPSLENILFDPPVQCCLIPPTADMPVFLNLNPRIVAMGVREELIETQNPLPWIINFLSNLPSPKKVEEIYFHGSMKYNIEKEKWDDSWMRLDALLTSQRFSHLKVVDFFLYDGLKGDELDQLRKSMKEFLPNLSRQGNLLLSLPEFDFVPQDERHWAAIKSGPWRYGVGF